MSQHLRYPRICVILPLMLIVDGAVLYVGLAIPAVGGGFNARLLSSSDGGATWGMPFNAPVDNEIAAELAVRDLYEFRRTPIDSFEWVGVMNGMESRQLYPAGRPD